MPDQSLSELFRLDGKVALVTGGAGLLGSSYCQALLESGARVVVGDLDRERAEALADALGPAETLGTWLDVADESSVQAAVNHAVERFGRLDILVNNAALTVRGGSEVLRPADYFAPLEQYRRDVWQRALDVNLTGMLLCAQAAGRQMLAQGGGVIVNIASTYGVVAPDQRLYEGVVSPYAGSSVGFNTPVSYAVTKTAVLGLT
ncbi:MAG: SDR family NAD(P)-dependent oxidoreductase, partial [Chloroflexota bacterium]|nr:SDR family NAD(P)-dependent oxidoreductase [Chloroflexota bacterium]